MLENTLSYKKNHDSVWVGFSWLKAEITCSYSTVLSVLQEPITDKYKEKVTALWYFENPNNNNDYLSFWLYKQEIPKTHATLIQLSVDVNSKETLDKLLDLFKIDKDFSFTIEDDLEPTPIIKKPKI